MAEKGEVSPAVDIYALGVTLFQMFTGRYPFQGDTPIRVMMAHASEPIPDVRQARPDLPEAITWVIDKAMAKRPEDRYATVDELANDLRQVAQGNQPSTANKELHTIGLNAAPAQRPAALIAKPAPTLGESPSSPAPSPIPYMSAPEPMYTPPPTPQKRGCNFALIAGVIGGLMGLACIGIFLAFGGLAALGLVSPTATDTPTPTIVKSTAISLTIDNQSDTVICSIFISFGVSSQWGNDWLASDTSIAVGETYTIDTITPGTYDLSATDCDNNVIAEKYDFDMVTGEQTWVVTTDLVELTVINNGSLRLCELYIISAGSEGWGLNQLDAEEAIDSGSEFTITNIPVGSYNLKVVACEGLGGSELYDQMLDKSSEWTIDDSEQ